MKVHVYQCDICAKTVDDQKKVTEADGQHFCEDCVRKRKIDVKDYAKKLDGDVNMSNEKFQSFMIRAQTVLTAVGIDAAVHEAKCEAESKQKSASTSGTAGFAN